MVGHSTDLVDWHCIHLDQGYAAFHQNDFETALSEFEMALAIDDRPMAQWDRALTLLALGHYVEGFRGWRFNWQLYNAEITPRAKQWYFFERRPLWKGEPGKRVTILGEAGFGDQIQMLRFVPLAQQLAPILLDMPEPMQRLAMQIAPLADDNDGECICPMFDLPVLLHTTPATIPPPPYLRPDVALTAQWANRIGKGGRRRIGIAWSTKLDERNEHPHARRGIPLEQFLELLPLEGELYSLQMQEREKATGHGIRADAFEDFADVAALISHMDSIVSIDTAALHVAGAIGHPSISALLPYAPTWRWLNGCPWYPKLNLCRQQSPGDWPSAFSQVRS